MHSIMVISGLVLGAVALAVATESAATQSVNPVYSQGSELQGPEPRDDHGGHHVTHYHQSHGQELFAGDEWMLAVPLLLIPLIALGCWYFWGGSKDDGYGWDRMGYSGDSTNNNYQSQGAYESRMFRGADSLDKRTHQRIFNAIQQ